MPLCMTTTVTIQARASQKNESQKKLTCQTRIPRKIRNSGGGVVYIIIADSYVIIAEHTLFYSFFFKSGVVGRVSLSVSYY